MATKTQPCLEGDPDGFLIIDDQNFGQGPPPQKQDAV
jgi:hypothetical protein